MARLITDFKASSIVGIGIDEKTAVAIGDNGSTKVFGSSNAYSLFPNKKPEQCEAGKKLTWNQKGKAISVYARKGSSTGTEGINLLEKTKLSPDQYWSVVDGNLIVK